VTASSEGASVHRLVQVSAGPGRIIYLVLALLAGLYVWRRPQDPVRLLWLAGVILGARCYFEAVMTPYYLTPPLILLLVMAARRRTWRFPVSVAVATGVSWFAYWHFDPWGWWPPVVVAMTVVMALSYPTATSTDREGHKDEVPATSVRAMERDTSVDLEFVS
jgi:Na+/proline symporter